MKADLINLNIVQAAGIAVMGYLVVFLGLILLMLVILAMASYFIGKAKAEAAVPAAAAPAAEAVVKAVPAEEKPKASEAPGTAGQLKLYDTDPRDAAMIMAIVANTTGKKLNELRFKSIREVK